MGVTRTEAIKNFLRLKTLPDLAALYDYSMECQVNVAQGDGDRIDGEYNGKKTYKFTDGVQTWKNFRIPYNASTNPEYEDSEMNFDLLKHAEGIGMTGWDWVNRVSKWVAFDFDAILGHSDKHASKLSSEELAKVREAAINIPWVTVRLSTSGKGLHLYVFLDNIPTANHTEHAALARAILARMNAETAFDFSSKVDICGGNMWVWHRKMEGTDGLKLIKEGEFLDKIPENWRAHLEVIRGKSRKVYSPMCGRSDATEEVEQKFDILVGQRNRIQLDAEHMKLIKWLNDNGHYNWWDADHHMLVCHTLGLKAAHTDLNLRGIFETDSKGTSTHNCFLFPMRRGAWSVRRYSPGCKEHPSWEQDGANWTRCYFNTDPTLRSATIAHGGLEDPQTGAYIFQRGYDAVNAGIALGANIQLPAGYDNRKTSLKVNKKDGRLIIEFENSQHDEPAKLTGWLEKKGKWVRMFSVQKAPVETDVELHDDTIRHVISQEEDAGWVAQAEGRWVQEPLSHIKLILKAMGLNDDDVQKTCGASVRKPWTLVTQPFQPEYPGDRIWNRNSPQFKFPPALSDNLNYPTWNMILDHLGKSLTPVMEANKWAKGHGIKTGADYLKYWIASMFQFPHEHLPYLFIYGEKQATGKSSLHEALSLLFYPGICRADVALQNTSQFNAELEGAILCIIEETDLGGKNTQAYNRIKDWVTSPMLSIHRKGHTPYMISNTTHWMQMSNNKTSCPIFPGDERIVYIYVDALEKEIPKNQLMRQLEKEGPDFLRAVLDLEIPESTSRLRIPVIDTADKRNAIDSQRNSLEMFLKEKCFYVPGAIISMGDFYETFIAYCDPMEKAKWGTKQSVTKHMPTKFPKGRIKGDASWYWGNIAFSDIPGKSPLVTVGDRLIPEQMNSAEAIQGNMYIIGNRIDIS